MRILLATAAAIAPLMMASNAMAQVVISTVRTTPIATSNAATGGGADSIRIASGGSVNVASGVAVAVDSSNSVDIDSGGAINMSGAASDVTGILVNGGNTGNVTVGGTITISDDITSSTDVDTDNDGDIDGPFANGSGRFGVRVAGVSPFVGDILVETGAQITVDGNNSAGIFVEGPLTGNVDVQGTLAVQGSNSYALRTTGAISGNVRVTGAVTARGEGTTGVSIEGDVGGRVNITSNLAVSGYRYTTRPSDRPTPDPQTSANNESILYLDELDADDLLQGGTGVTIAANVANGVVLDRAPTYSSRGIEGDDDGDGTRNGDEDDDGDTILNRVDPDRDGDGLLDNEETIAQISTFGSAPGIQIGSASRSISLGAVGTGTNAYGFINRGTVTSQGVYDGIAANAVVVGGNPGQGVALEGGLRNEGTLATLALEAAATTLRFGEGAVAPTLFNQGTISAGTSAETTAGTATAVRIDAGANVASIVNMGNIAASTGGGISNTVAIQDLSGSLISITNSRFIQATVNANTDNDPVSGTATAIDVSANTSGVTILQTGTNDGDDDNDSTTTDPDEDGDGVDDGDEPGIVGIIRLGAGADTVDIRNGVVIGDVFFGNGADTLSISGGATVSGTISDTDGLLDINITNGRLNTRQTTPLSISNLNIAPAGDLIINLDPAASTAGGLNVSGTATLADGAGLGVRFSSLLAAPTRFTLIDAATLNYGAIDLSSLTTNSPYLYVVTAGADVPAGQVFADVRRRTTDEAGLIPVEAALYESFYSSIGTAAAENIRTAFLNQTSRENFINLYEQLLPDHSGGPLLSLASGVDAVTRALTGRNASAAPGETSAWVQEINFYADKDRTDTYGFRSEGFGVAGGVERGTGLGAVGITAAFTSSDLEDPESEAEEFLSASLFELGLYWRAQGQHWTTWARASAGYATFESERRFIGAGLNLANESSWNGFTLAAAGGASYERQFGRFSIRPEGYLEFFSLSEDAHTEVGGGDGFDLEIDDREGHLFSAVAAVNFGLKMGDDDWLRPELRVGWRQNISVDPGETIARFRSGGSDFTLSPQSIEGGGPIAGFRLNIGNELGMLTISADAEMIDDYVRYMLFLRASFRF